MSLSDADRHCWRSYWNPGGKGEQNWLRMLDKVEQSHRDPLFVLLPDAVGDWPLTLEKAQRYHREVFDRDLPVAIALQDGCCFREALDMRPQYVFVGGTTAWKWANAEAICRYFQPRGIKVHVGRASGWRRVQECLRIGADSCDGTGWFRAADRMLPTLWPVLDGTLSQQSLGI